MASILKVNGRWGARIRKSGFKDCKTFDTKGAAKAWATKEEAKIDGYRATGKLNARGLRLADLIKHHTEEIYPLKPYGRSKQHELAKLAREIGGLPAKFTAPDLSRWYTKRIPEGAGPVVVAASLSYLGKVLRIARDLWHLDVSLESVRESKSALSLADSVGRS